MLVLYRLCIFYHMKKILLILFVLIIATLGATYFILQNSETMNRPVSFNECDENKDGKVDAKEKQFCSDSRRIPPITSDEEIILTKPGDDLITYVNSEENGNIADDSKF